ncbi:unnamed protein product [Closterium sp. Naga37s-1]|nr:unnamed protein product [Closterium sp. Naga37s-1]
MPRGEWEQWRRRRNAPRRVGAVAAAAKCPAASGVVAAEAKCPAASGSSGGGGEMPRGEWEQWRRRRNAPRRVGAEAAAAKCPAASGSSGGGGEMPRGEWSSGGGGEMPRGEWEQWRRRRNAPRRVGAVAAAAKCPAASGNSGGGGEMPRGDTHLSTRPSFRIFLFTPPAPSPPPIRISLVKRPARPPSSSFPHAPTLFPTSLVEHPSCHEADRDCQHEQQQLRAAEAGHMQQVLMLLTCSPLPFLLSSPPPFLPQPSLLPSSPPPLLPS